MADRIADIWGTRTPHAKDTPWPVRVDLHLDEGLAPSDVDAWVQSACVLCSNGCACDIAVKDGRMVGIRGRAGDVVNHGRLGPKGLYGSWQWNRTDRLTRPLVRSDGRLQETDWDTAMSLIVRRSRELLDETGPLSHGFYTSGQLFLEEYYTLGVIGKAGLGTPHMDGNTRLCTATAAAALKETFGSDGQPGSYSDIESCDALFLFGHNMAETQTVLWARVLDRLHGADPPVVVAVDPRRTPVTEACAQSGGVHLAPLPGTNQALMNGLIREIITRGWIDHDYVAAHTLGYDELAATVEPYTPEHVARICRIDPHDVRRAAEVFGTSDRVLSTVLQGFYQSHQATAAACQVNNLHLLRGLLGRPGCGILQMNGQPTAQNTREAGADGDLPGFRNWDNPEHIQQLAELWNVDPLTIPHWAPPTHAMQIWRYAEQGSIRFLWISATNPAVSLPELPRIREILAKEDLFVVVQDGFLTETAEYADVVLPAALWGEKQGTFTNVNRTVHLSEKAVEPPGEARSDLDIFLDYARRMDLRDRDGDPLIKWSDPESAFEAWKECSRGRLCDYTGLSYDRLRGGSGIPWPCNDEYPDGCDRLYADAVFPTHADVCESYGRDLLTGGTTSRSEYHALRPEGQALLRSAEYVSPPEQAGGDYPFVCTTGRTVYHFHTRTKTGRSRRLRRAAPEPWVELSERDAAELGVAEGDVVSVESRRGRVELPVRVGRGRDGVVFLPFHYGYWDSGADGHTRAANELTLTDWDPVSKQPLYKLSAVRVTKLADGAGPAPAPTTTASAPHDPAGVTATSGNDDVAEDVAVTEPPPPAPTPDRTPNVPHHS
ncbi:molybdopterin oxidoreductase family protein [Saccharomonospora cyanea]|uniref:Anaerobic dehydrogenase, typically selenocysteine-containing n=1 Tax=Saccharomonospora cyanea NA-134 TaxID=882082 RepID=H5XIB3_9PSEU|nr:molybdopterin oxidoreductase family protein [Saccharomonospora cyanea]EHR61741.1 anaerobic dehydrogenase, typically selenocysteine-containing [Saccharomonospora cyanea NA-134]